MPRSSPASSLADGLRLFNAGKPAQALAFFQRARKLGGGSADVDLYVVHCQQSLGRAADAVKTAAALVEEHPDFLQGRLALGNVLRLAGRPEEAIAALESAVALSPTDQAARGALCEALYHRALECEACKAAPEAQTLWRRLKELRPAAAEIAAALRSRKLEKGRARALRLTAKQRKELLTEGYAILRGLIPAKTVAAARKAIEARLAEPAALRAGLEPGNPEVWVRLMDEPELMALLYETPLWALAGSLLGRVRLDNQAQVVVRFQAKKASPGPSNYHVDGFYAPKGQRLRDTSFTLTFCVLLSDLPGTDAGNFAVCPGSHRVLADHIERSGYAALRKGLPQAILPKPIQLKGKAGDVILTHYQLAHAGERNLSPRPRHAAFFRLKHADHAALWEKALTDLWLEWPGLR